MRGGDQLMGKILCPGRNVRPVSLGQHGCNWCHYGTQCGHICREQGCSELSSGTMQGMKVSGSVPACPECLWLGSSVWGRGASYRPSPLSSLPDGSVDILGIQSWPALNPVRALALPYCGSLGSQLMAAIMLDSLHAIDLRNFD